MSERLEISRRRIPDHGSDDWRRAAAEQARDGDRGGRTADGGRRIEGPDGSRASVDSARPAVTGHSLANVPIMPQAESAAGAAGGPLSPETAARIEGARGDGAALDAGTRTAMEGAFGTSFADVRIHAGGEADILNRGVGARAFTTGSDIFFRQGGFEPGSSGGRQLLAHELTHVVQQRGASTSEPTIVGPAGDGAEQEAEAVSAEVARLPMGGLGTRVTPRLARRAAQRAGVLQRVRFDGAGSTETLLWDQNIPGSGTPASGGRETATNQLQPRDFSAGGGHYDLTRDSAGVHADVRIVFLDTTEAAIPASDPRRAWASQMCQTLVHTWNGDHGRFELLSRRLIGGLFPVPAPPPTATPVPASPAPASPAAGSPAPAASGTAAAPDPNEIRLPLRFSATALFDPDAEKSFPRVHVHGASQTATGSLTSGTAITANQWFMNKNNNVYPASYESIYAHEYGHLLGIPDEYSQNNPQMHALFHHISPQRETQMQDQLDRAASDMLVLSALQPQLLSTVNGVAALIGDAIRAQHQPIDSALAAAIRGSWRQGATVDFLSSLVRLQLTLAGQSKAAKAVPTSAHFEAFENLSNITLAEGAVAAEIDPAHIQAIVLAAFTNATNPRNTVTIHYPGGSGAGDASLTVSMSTSTNAQTNASTGPLAQAARSAAAATTTPAPAPVAAGRSHMPRVQPSNTIIGRLEALPATWRGVANLMSEQTNNMSAQIMAAVLGTPLDVTRINDNAGALYRVLYEIVNNVSNAVARYAVRDFLAKQINPIVDQQVKEILSLVQAEVQKNQLAAGTGTSAAPGATPDPQVAAAARQMGQQVQVLLNRLSPGATAVASALNWGPLAQTFSGSGTAAQQTAQDVAYTVQSQMGDNVASNAVRPDQMEGIVGNINNSVPGLRHADEDKFTIHNT